MALTGEQKSFCVLDYHVNNSVISVQRHFRTKYGRDPPTGKTIRTWYEKFRDTGCICKRKSTGRPSAEEETVDRVRASFVRSPQKSTYRAARELEIPQKTVWRILRKRLQMKSYRLQLLHALRDTDYAARASFCADFLTLMEEDGFAERLRYSDEAVFHLSGNVNRHNVRIWGTDNPHECVEHQRDSPKVNVFCAISPEKIYGPFFFLEPTVTGHVFLDMLQQWLLPQLDEDSADFILQLDGAPPHYHGSVRDHLNEALPQRWIGRASQEDRVLIRWPPRSPDLTPCDFFLWGFIKDRVYVPPLPTTLGDLRARITAAIAEIDRDTLHKVWQEIDYRLDVCRVTRGAHIEHL